METCNGFCWTGACLDHTSPDIVTLLLNQQKEVLSALWVSTMTLWWKTEDSSSDGRYQWKHYLKLCARLCSGLYQSTFEAFWQLLQLCTRSLKSEMTILYDLAEVPIAFCHTYACALFVLNTFVLPYSWWDGTCRTFRMHQHASKWVSEVKALWAYVIVVGHLNQLVA